MLLAYSTWGSGKGDSGKITMKLFNVVVIGSDWLTTCACRVNLLMSSSRMNCVDRDKPTASQAWSRLRKLRAYDRVEHKYSTSRRAHV